MALVVVVDLKSMAIRAGVLAFLALVSAAYAEDRFHHQDWRYFCYAAGVTFVLLLLSYCNLKVMVRALSSR